MRTSAQIRERIAVPVGADQRTAGVDLIGAGLDCFNDLALEWLIGEDFQPFIDGMLVPLTEAYDRALLATLKSAARAAEVELREGVYMWFSGPSFETPAEIRAAKILGADLVGMSTVPEVLIARYFGLRCVAASLVTNFAAHHGLLIRAHGQVIVAESVPGAIIDSVHFVENAEAMYRAACLGRVMPLNAKEIADFERDFDRDRHLAKLWDYYVGRGRASGLLRSC